MKRAGLVVLGTMLLIMSTYTAYASDYGSDYHWHNAYYNYQIRSSVPSGWHNAINEAAESWNDNTEDMTLEEYSSSYKWIMKGEMPGGTCTSASAACTDVYLVGAHISVSDITLNEDVSFGTNTFNCILGYPDVQETMAHEFGHAAGWLGHTSSGGSIMRSPGPSGCSRLPSEHDIDHMDQQVTGH